MPFATADDGIRLYYEETGSGAAIVFVHEFAGDHRSWEAQLRFFARRRRCIAYAARGYPPSDIPSEPERYSQPQAVADTLAILDHLGLAQAHIVGLSMGGFATLHFGLRHPKRALSLLVAGCGYGAKPGPERTAFQADSERTADQFLREGMAKTAAIYGASPSRLTLRAKDPRGYAEFAERLAAHSALGSALTMKGVQAKRPSLWDFADELKRLTVPTLIVAGDEDTATLEPALFLKSHVPNAALAIFPATGHAINLEEPDGFNRVIAAFHAKVEAGRWPLSASAATQQSENQ